MDLKIHASSIIQNKNKILLVRESKKLSYGKWNLPGGHLDKGETFAQAAIREAFEETGLVITLKSLIGFYSGFYRSSFYIRVVFLGKFKEQIMIQGSDILELKWMVPEKVLKIKDENLISPFVLKQILTDYLTGKSYPLNVIKEFCL